MKNAFGEIFVSIVTYFVTLFILDILTGGHFIRYARTSMGVYNQESKKKKWKKAAKAFGVRVSKLKKMSKDEIKRLYRKLANGGVHPDKGGDAETFRDLHESYEFVYANV